MYHTDLTVAAIVRHQGRYLIVDERAMRRDVLTQPAGHIEAGETPEQAVTREVLEETGCTVECGELVGVYLWIHPQTRQQFLRIVYAAEFLSCDHGRPLDDGIHARLWLTRDEIEQERMRLRTPVVLRCIEDFEAGRRESDALFTDMHPLQHNMDSVLARAALV
ncbi:MAG: NUDIX domain-containing protein [Woeseiaceae bacterium]|nr:NUDIX domain-containing protein [Woeseiaceae bacterium]